jgi:hypothetical protein
MYVFVFLLSYAMGLSQVKGSYQTFINKISKPVNRIPSTTLAVTSWRVVVLVAVVIRSRI